MGAAATRLRCDGRCSWSWGLGPRTNRYFHLAVAAPVNMRFVEGKTVKNMTDRKKPYCFYYYRYRFARYGAICIIACYIALKHRNVIARYFSQPKKTNFPT